MGSVNNDELINKWYQNNYLDIWSKKKKEKKTESLPLFLSQNKFHMIKKFFLTFLKRHYKSTRAK